MSAHGFGLLVAFVVLTGALALAALYFRRIHVAPTRLRSILLNLTLAVFAVLYALLILEIVVKHAFVETDGMDFTLSSRQWFDRHWTPINEYGFRDTRIDLAALRDARRLYVLGDSFAAGHGIADRADRFSDVLARRLDAGWRVVNMARIGWGTAQELQALENFPLKPHVVVLSYVFNDIEGAAARAGLKSDDYLYMPSLRLKRVVDQSYLLNLLYWRFYWRITKGPEVSRAYREFLERSFADPQIWGQHREELLGIIGFTRRAGARLLVVIFPSFLDPAGTRRILSPLYGLLAEERVPLIDLAEVYEGRPLDELVVNSLDHHPNAAVHAEVAGLIHDRMAAEGMLEE